jgi:heat-inducible transcriptional repressor
MKLSAREQLVFSAVMDLYCNGMGNPVASSHVAKQNKIDIGSASVRNVMSRLEKSGLLYSPHTSAGRIPTQQGFDYWFDEYFQLTDIAHYWQPSAQALTEFSHQLSQRYQICVLVSLPEAVQQHIYRAEVLDFSVENWLVLLFNKDGQSQNIQITKPLEANDELRNQFNAWLNIVFGGHNLAEGLRRMVAMQQTAPMFCHGSLTMWINALAEQLNVDNSIVIGSHYLYGELATEQINKIGSPFLDFVEHKLAMKMGVSVMHQEMFPFAALEDYLLLSIPYFSQGIYQGRMCLICPKSAKIEAIINEISINSVNSS